MLAVINKDIRESTYELNRLERIVEERRRKLHEAMEDVSALRRKLHGLHSLAELNAHRELETSCNA